MKALRILALIGLGLICLPVAVAAQETGFYAGADVGYHSPDRLNTPIDDSNADFKWTLNDNAAAFLRAGYAFDFNLRLEIEGGYRPSAISAIQTNLLLPVALSRMQPRSGLIIPFSGQSFFNVGGHDDASTLMANAIYDIPLDFPIHPFIGGGIGLVHSDITAHGSLGFCPVCLRPAPICFICTLNMNVDDSSDNFGWQAVAGFSVPIAPQWTLDTTYRYVGASGVRWNAINTTGLYAPGPFHADYSDNSVTVGVRYSFGG